MPSFEEAHDITMKVVAVGSGEALELGRGGDADVLLVHSPEAEVRFMEEGHGISRKPVMSNRFVIAGPADDPANVASAPDVVEVFDRIARAQAAFLSRGDESGTHKKELAIWRDAGIEPSGDWYLSSGQGMAETISIAAQTGAYLLTDSATFAVVRSKGDLKRLFSGDGSLDNPYSVIVTKKSKNPKAAEAFSSWITSGTGSRLISSYGVEIYDGAPLFTPVTDGP